MQRRDFRIAPRNFWLVCPFWTFAKFSRTDNFGPKPTFVSNEFRTLDFLKPDVHNLTNKKRFEVGNVDGAQFSFFKICQAATYQSWEI